MKLSQDEIECRNTLPPWQKVPGQPFLVDRFGKGTEKMACKSWFLTHFHSDHYKGLTSQFKGGVLPVNEPCISELG